MASCDVASSIRQSLVLGSFNGEISRLELGPDGVPVTVKIHGLPEVGSGRYCQPRHPTHLIPRI